MRFLARGNGPAIAVQETKLSGTADGVGGYEILHNLRRQVAETRAKLTKDKSQRDVSPFAALPFGDNSYPRPSIVDLDPHACVLIEHVRS